MVSSVANARTRLLAGSRGRLLNATLFLLIAIALVILATRVAALGPAYFIQILVYGLANGSIFALIALGYTMVYGIVELINFAHGDVFTLGGFISLWLLPIFGITEGGSVSGAGLILPLLAILVISMLACAVVNVTIERVAYRPLRHAPRLAPLITAVGMSFVLEGVMFVARAVQPPLPERPADGRVRARRPERAGDRLQGPRGHRDRGRAHGGAELVRRAHEAREGHARDGAGPRRRRS